MNCHLKSCVGVIKFSDLLFHFISLIGNFRQVIDFILYTIRGSIFVLFDASSIAILIKSCISCVPVRDRFDIILFYIFKCIIAIIQLSCVRIVISIFDWYVFFALKLDSDQVSFIIIKIFEYVINVIFQFVKIIKKEKINSTQSI